MMIAHKFNTTVWLIYAIILIGITLINNPVSAHRFQRDDQWVIYSRSTDLYSDDWSDPNRRYNQIKQLYTSHHHHVRRRCTHRNGHHLCLCRFLHVHHYSDTEHFCSKRHFTGAPSHSIIDTFSESAFDAGDAAIASAIRNGVSFYVDQYQRGEILTIDSLWLVLLIARNDLEYQSIAQQWYSQLPFADDFRNPFLRIFPGQKRTALSKFRDLEIRQCCSNNLSKNEW